MFSVETLPQSIVDTKTIILKPRLDQGDVQLIGEEIKPRLFSKFGFKSKPEHVKLLGSEIYFEPYLIIGGKYSLDYCKKHVFKVNVEESTTKVYVAGQEFKSVQSGPKATGRTIKMTGQENAHHERQAYFILDRLKREISPDRLPISPFDIQKDHTEHSSSFKSINISDETQIEFLKAKIATRPADVAEIIREIFDITDRTIAYYPMYQLTFENIRNDTEAVITINAITGEIMLNGTQRLAAKTIVGFPENADTKPVKVTTYQTIQPKPELNINPEKIDLKKNSPAENNDDQRPQLSAEEEVAPINPAEVTEQPFLKGQNSVVVEYIEVPSGSIINRNIVTKDTLRVGDKCKIQGTLETLKDISVGADTVINGDLVSGGNVTIGARSLVTGALQVAGCIKIGENATIQGGIFSHLATQTLSKFQLEVVEVEELQ